MRVLRDVLLIPFGILLFLSAVLVVLPFFGVAAAGAEVTDRGTAVAQRCRFAGPIADSNAPERGNIVGFGHICRARVTWRDGTTELREVSGSQLTPDDIGDEVAVVERAVDASARGSGTRPQLYRADFEPHPVLAGIAVIAVSLLGGACALAGAANLHQRFRGKEHVSNG